MLRAAQLLLVFCLSGSFVRAQDQPLYTYEQLSNICYAAQKDSLKKAWTCSDVSDDRNIQKKFKNSMYCEFAITL